MSVKNISIDTIGLSVRSVNALHKIKVYMVEELLKYDEEQLLHVRNLGQKSVDEIISKIEEYKKLDAFSLVSDVTKTEYIEDMQTWLKSEAGKKQILHWLEEKKIPINVLELLSAKTYNLLMINEYEYLYQFAFLTKDELLKIPRMEEINVAEIIKWVDAYIQENANDIYTNISENSTQKALPLSDMRFMPEHQEKILEFVLKNNIDVESMPISARPKNQLHKNGYRKLSDIIFLSENQIKQIPAMGSNSAQQIMNIIHDYLKKHESRILAFCNGDTSVLWDNTAIRKKILNLYTEAPFAGFSLNEMTEKMNLPSEISINQIKKNIGSLLAEQKLEYVDYRCYRIYEKFESFLKNTDAIDDRSKYILQQRLQGKTLEEIGQEFDITRERVRQIIKKNATNVRNKYAMITGDHWFDEDYYWYFYENYSFDRRNISQWMSIPQSVWSYLDMMDVKQGKRDLETALDDSENLEISLRLKVKNYLNRNKIFLDGIWVEKKRSELEPIIAKRVCQNEISFNMFAKAFNDFLTEEEIPFDEDLYYTDAVTRTRKNRLADAKFILWKQNEMLRYYNIDSRDYSELLETLKLDTYENIEYSTLKFVREYPQLMEKYDIRDQYELHNLLRKIIPEGSFHNISFGRMPLIKFGDFHRDAAIWDILVDLSPIGLQELCERVSDEYGYDPASVQWNYLSPFSAYYHEGVYSVDQKVMPKDRMELLHLSLPDDFYYLDEIRKIYSDLYADADLEEINPYNLKSMGFIVLSRYAVQNHPSLEDYCEHLLSKDDIIDLQHLRQRLTYVVMFSNKLTEMRRNLDIIEFEPGQILNFRKLAKAGITKKDIKEFCDAVYEFVPEGTYFNAHSLKADGFESELYDLGFSDWFYSNLLFADDRFSFSNAFGNIILYKGKKDITIQSMLINRVCDHGWIDIFDLMTELEERYDCKINEKSDITYRLKNTPIYHDKILDRLYANTDLYYRDLEEGGF